MDDKNDSLWVIAEQCIKQQNNYGYLVPDLFPTKPLFRYRANISRAIDEIRESYIYLSPIQNLNDPFDSSYIVPFEEAKTESHSGEFFYDRCYFIKKAEWYSSVKNELQNTGILKTTFTMSAFFDLLAEITRKYGGRMGASVMMELYYEHAYSFVLKNYGFSASFSEKKDNILMWSYYADSHRGVCLEYDLSKLNVNDSEQKAILSSLKKVWYSGERYCDRDGSYTPFVKAQEWAHEQEWRLFNKTIEGKVKFPCLCSVYLGMNFDIESNSFNQIVSAIKSSAQEINLFVCHPDISTYKINPIKILL